MMGGGFGAPGLGAVVGGLGTCLLLLAMLNAAGLSVPLATRTRTQARPLPLHQARAGGGPHYYAGRVTRKHADGRLDIEYDDGDSEVGLGLALGLSA